MSATTTSTLTAQSIEQVAPGLARVAFAWDEGGAGTLAIGFAGD